MTHTTLQRPGRIPTMTSQLEAQIHSMERQAYRYGEQVRLLEDSDRDEERAIIRKAYLAFIRQCPDLSYIRLVEEAYYEAYCQ